jgi:hypothetical protein
MEGRQEVIDRGLLRVDAKEADPAIDRREEQRQARSKGDAPRIGDDAGDPEARLIQGDSFKHRGGEAFCSAAGSGYR